MSQHICLEVFLKLIFVISRKLGQLLQVKKCYLQKTTCSTLIIETNKYEYIKNYFMILILGKKRYQALVGVEHQRIQ